MKPETIKHLHNNKDFLEFCESVHKTREYWISQLHDVSTERLQQISGRILALDDILLMSKYEDMAEEWSKIER